MEFPIVQISSSLAAQLRQELSEANTFASSPLGFVIIPFGRSLINQERLQEIVKLTGYHSTGIVESVPDGTSVVSGVKIGDVVKLKSGGPPMTVRMKLSEGNCRCVWFNDGIVHTDNFREAVLIPAQPQESPES
jgi:uncharacterized protein YodC (DUF2158 family)